jgi:hypothetical protein
MTTTTGALLHFKFLADFAERARREAARSEHYSGAVEYRAYARMLERDGDLVLADKKSRRWKGSADLVALGLMAPGEGWRR